MAASIWGKNEKKIHLLQRNMKNMMIIPWSGMDQGRVLFGFFVSFLNYRIIINGLCFERWLDNKMTTNINSMIFKLPKKYIAQWYITKEKIPQSHEGFSFKFSSKNQLIFVSIHKYQTFENCYHSVRTWEFLPYRENDLQLTFYDLI